MYSRMLAENMAALIRANKDKLARNPNLTRALPYLFSLPALTLWDFDIYYACEEKVDIDDNTVHDDTGSQRYAGARKATSIGGIESYEPRRRVRPSARDQRG